MNKTCLNVGDTACVFINHGLSQSNSGLNVALQKLDPVTITSVSEERVGFTFIDQLNGNEMYAECHPSYVKVVN